MERRIYFGSHPKPSGLSPMPLQASFNTKYCKTTTIGAITFGMWRI